AEWLPHTVKTPQGRSAPFAVYRRTGVQSDAFTHTWTIRRRDCGRFRSSGPSPRRRFISCSIAPSASRLPPSDCSCAKETRETTRLLWISNELLLDRLLG